MKLVSIFSQRVQYIFYKYTKNERKYETCFNIFTASALYIRVYLRICKIPHKNRREIPIIYNVKKYRVEFLFTLKFHPIKL